MDFVYGEICQKALKNEYKGGKTDMAEVVIIDNIIYVKTNNSYISKRMKGLEDEIKRLKGVIESGGINNE